MRLHELTIGCLSALLLGGCMDANLDRGISSPTRGVLTSLDPAASEATAGITITLDMQPNRATDIAFVSAGKKVKDFVLDDDNTSSVPSSRSFTKLKAGTYTILAADVAGVTLTQINCTSSAIDNNSVSLADRSVAITLEEGENVSCTFVGNQPLWPTNDFTTYTQDDWNYETGPAGTLLSASFTPLYDSEGALTIGTVGSGYTMAFTSAGAVFAFLPQSGATGPLTASTQNPTSTAAGALAGDIVALRLDVDLSDASRLTSASGTPFGDVTICSPDIPVLNGMTVRQFLDVATAVMTAGSTVLTTDGADTVASLLAAAFRGGVPSSFAQQYLVRGSCP